MKTCPNPNCNQALPKNTAFCPYCSTQTQSKVALWIRKSKKGLIGGILVGSIVTLITAVLIVGFFNRGSKEVQDPIIDTPIAIIEKTTPSPSNSLTPISPSPISQLPTKTRLSSITPVPSITDTMMPSNTLIPSAAHTFEATLGVGSTQISAVDGMVMVYVPDGEFLFGSTEKDLMSMLDICPSCRLDTIIDQKPQRTIFLDAFWIDRTEVTNYQFAQFVTGTNYKSTAERIGTGFVYKPTTNTFVTISGADWQHPNGSTSNIAGKENEPVSQISWDDAEMYCSWAGRRLPTEAEWEKAARGIDGRLFPWGRSQPQSSFLNFNLTNNGPVSVESFPNGASPYGATDMSGNLWEWTADYYRENYYSIAPYLNPKGPSTGDGYVKRGGSWATLSSTEMVFVMTTFRLWNIPEWRNNVSGFRCAMNDAP